MASPFSEILKIAVERTPGAIGGAFAARDGEMVDWFATVDRDEWAILTAHYGVVMAHIQAWLNTRHYGEANLVMMQHTGMDILIYAVQEGYYALLAVGQPAPLAVAVDALSHAAVALRQEM